MLMLNKYSTDEKLGDGSGSPERSEVYKRTAPANATLLIEDESQNAYLFCLYFITFALPI